jgi:chemotaxis family two-component system sensor histidine kinase/response regulator PixL
VRELIQFRLTRAGERVEAGKDGEEALSLIQSMHPALAVLDIMMPKLNGYEVTRSIRSDPAFGRMPVSSSRQASRRVRRRAASRQGPTTTCESRSRRRNWS